MLERLDALLAIGKLLAPRAKTLAADVTQAFEAPKAYIAAHAKSMAERGIEKPKTNLAWIALIDALRSERALAEIDWKLASRRGTKSIQSRVARRLYARGSSARPCSARASR